MHSGILFSLGPMDEWEKFIERLAEDLHEQIARHKLASDAVRMIGLLFARPQSALAKAEILPNMGYFHVRSAEFISIFCAGYSDRQPWDDCEEVADLKGKQWKFSNYGFDRIRQRLETCSKWRYSGGVQLMLTNAKLFGEFDALLDFSSVICADFDEMKRVGAIASVESFFEALCRFSEEPDQLNPTWAFSDRLGARIAGSALKSFVLSLLPKSLGADVQKAAHFAVVDISKESGWVSLH
ncbi:MAG TPA: hypothetical protein VI636_22760 [Candidatus Angelobacter sp.]